MNNSYDLPREQEIDFSDIIWKLLMQWKAILAACILMALLVSGIKYVGDRAVYKKARSTAEKNKAIAEEQASQPAEDRISDELEKLPENDRQAVLFLVQQQDLIDQEYDYLDNSIWVNTTPTSQRQLTIKYLLKSSEGTDMRSLAEAYAAGIRSDDFMKSLREIVSPDSKLEYIRELVSSSEGLITSDEAASAVYTITIVLPEEADSSAVTALVSDTFSADYDDIAASVGGHSISQTDTIDTHIFNQVAIDRRASTTNTINSLKGNIEKARETLSPEQQVALDSIIAIKHSSERSAAAPSVEDIPSPGFSVKHAVLGFILGAFLYAGIYAAVLIFSRAVASARNAQKYTGIRLLGELYKTKERRGIAKLFTSKAIAKRRYGDKLDADKQTDATASVIDAVCSHHGSDALTLLLSGVSRDFDSHLERISGKCKTGENKISIEVLNADDIDEKRLSSAGNAAYVLSSKSRSDDLGRLMSLVRDYDLQALGTIYLEEL